MAVNKGNNQTLVLALLFIPSHFYAGAAVDDSGPEVSIELRVAGGALNTASSDIEDGAGYKFTWDSAFEVGYNKYLFGYNYFGEGDNVMKSDNFSVYSTDHHSVIAQFSLLDGKNTSIYPRLALHVNASKFYYYTGPIDFSKIYYHFYPGFYVGADFTPTNTLNFSGYAGYTRMVKPQIEYGTYPYLDTASIVFKTRMEYNFARFLGLVLQGGFYYDFDGRKASFVQGNIDYEIPNAVRYAITGGFVLSFSELMLN